MLIPFLGSVAIVMVVHCLTFFCLPLLTPDNFGHQYYAFFNALVLNINQEVKHKNIKVFFSRKLKWMEVGAVVTYIILCTPCDLSEGI